VYRRDAFRCTSPVCTRRDVTPHHLRFRSLGGGEERENLTSLCVWCHLHGIHEGRIAAEPPASRIRWRIGRRGTLRVEGRVRVAA
jgi:5-methylcytosine-specific restriction endonuclease McrA